MIFSKIVFSLLLLSFFMFSVFTCSDNSTNSDTELPDELVGEWMATQFLMTSKGNPSDQVDLVQQGIQFYLTLQKDGTYTSRMVIPDEMDDSETGSVSISGNVVTVMAPNEDPMQMTYTHTNNIFTLNDENSEFDFNDDGTETPARSTIVMIRLDEMTSRLSLNFQ